MTLTSNSTFPILGFEEKANVYYTVGTAYFINDSGTFITAAHTFNPAKECTFFALLNQEALPVNPIFSEYMEMWDQKPPIHRDLYIGQLEVKEKTPYYALVYSENLNSEDPLNFCGFASTKYTDQPETQEPKPPATTSEQLKSIDDLWADDLSENIKWPNVAESIEKLQTSLLTGTFIEHGFEKIHEKFNITGRFTNGFTFRLTNPEVSPKGLSGGPVIFDGNIAGMLIAKNAAISSEYIIEKLKEFAIDHSVPESHAK